jgi:hypothetical protein
MQVRIVDEPVGHEVAPVRASAEKGMKSNPAFGSGQIRQSRRATRKKLQIKRRVYV